jgi:hypothetical protein
VLRNCPLFSLSCPTVFQEYYQPHFFQCALHQGYDATSYVSNKRVWRKYLAMAYQFLHFIIRLCLCKITMFFAILTLKHQFSNLIHLRLEFRHISIKEKVKIKIKIILPFNNNNK